jgi:hypothetical protein
VSLLDLIRSRDGSMSLTKLAASTAHLLMALGFAVITWRDGFIAELWLIYGGFAISHAVVDKTAAQVKAFKERKEQSP